MLHTLTLNNEQRTFTDDQVHTALTTIAQLGKDQGLAIDAKNIIAETSSPEKTYPGPYVKDLVNGLAPQITASDDKDLVHLFHRALRQHDKIAENDPADPVPIHIRHYSPPPFQIPETDLVLDVQDDHVEVTTALTVQPTAAKHTSLVLDQKDQDIKSVVLNNKVLRTNEYRVTNHELIIFNVPTDEEFVVRIVSHINPFNNKSMAGLYKSGEILITQCEADDARRIFPTLDRSDVLSRYTVSIIADEKKYPFRISNGNLIKQAKDPSGLSVITWEDPFPKPSYLFATVLGDFGRLTDTYTTGTGKKVRLEVYTPPGEEERGEFSLWCLKKAMEFDEKFFDRVCDLDVFKMVATPYYNMGAMENKGLLIFNDSNLLCDPNSVEDQRYRWIALVVAHEYFHNWSGNRVTVRGWDQICLKEGFTDFRASLFAEWLWGKQFARIEDIIELREDAFNQAEGPMTHPLQVDSYVAPCYDELTYTLGREVFRTLRTKLNHRSDEDVFRKASNDYFDCNDGKAVTFHELFDAMTRITHKKHPDSEQWFYQAGIPKIKFSMDYDEYRQVATVNIAQSCPHPKTGEPQKPCHIPVFIELLGPDGECYYEPLSFDFSKPEIELTFSHVPKRPTPVFMHDLSAPVRVEFPYTQEELLNIVLHCEDPYCRWEAGQNYMKNALQDGLKMCIAVPDADIATYAEGAADQISPYFDAVLKSTTIPPHGKAQLLALPSPELLMDGWDTYDFLKAKELLEETRKLCVSTCLDTICKCLEEIPTAPYRPMTKEFVGDMANRLYRNTLMTHLAKAGKLSRDCLVFKLIRADNFTDRVAAIRLLVNDEDLVSKNLVAHFGEELAHNKTVFCNWIRARAAADNCTLEDMDEIFDHDAFDPLNPNQLGSWLHGFIDNVGRYHQPDGSGYAYVTDKILKIAEFNDHRACNIAEDAYKYYSKLPATNKEAMKAQLMRLKEAPGLSAGLRDLVVKTLEE